MKNKKYVRLLLILGICLFVFSSPSVALAREENHACDEDEFSSENGYVSQSFRCAGTRICEGAEFLFGQGACEGGGEEVVSFADFEGGLSQPSGRGLDESLKKARDLRQFIVNTVNYAITFLGLIAMVMIIYGGFLYVTAAGNEEQAGKGKKIIGYVAIGIIIVAISYVLVQALLQVGGPVEQEQRIARVYSPEGRVIAFDPRRGAAEDHVTWNSPPGGPGSGPGQTIDENPTGEIADQPGTNISQQIIYSMGALYINDAFNDFMGAYRNLLAIKITLDQIEKFPEPKTLEEKKSYVRTVKATISDIRQYTNYLSLSNKAARSTVGAIDAKVNGVNLEALSGEGLKTSIEGILVSPSGSAEMGLKKASQADFQAAIDGLIGPAKTEADIQGILESHEDERVKKPKGKLIIVRKIVGPIANISNSAVVNNAVQRGLFTEKDIQKAISGLDPNATVSSMFQEALTNLVNARGLAEDPDQPSLLAATVKSIDNLYRVVRDIEFVFVKINASAAKGSAPMIVELNGEDSRDPANKTIPDENYKWDPDGDGTDGVSPGSGVECDRVTGPIISCTYEKPGTFIVGLSITSADSTRIGAGQAFYPVTILPPIARINLKTSVGGNIAEDIRKYEKDPNGNWHLIIDKDEFQVTTQEAKNPGVSFDASESESGNGPPLKNFEWTFGDGAPVVDKDRMDHRYEREGKYRLKLEVTDQGGRKERKFLDIVVASIAARIGVTKTIGEPEELFEFDGTLSRSDHGSMNSYQWKIFDKEGREITNLANAVTLVGNTTSSVFRAKFKNPGNYSVELTVSDGSKTATTKIEDLAIKSRKPRANFTAKVCPNNCVDPTQPSLVELDAGLSFDPDRGDVLTYDWTFFTKEGEKLERGTQIVVVDNVELSGPQAKKLRVKFPEIGTYKVILRVHDSHQDVNILQEDITEKEIDIASTLEMRFLDSTRAVASLEAGQAPLIFEGTVNSAVRALVDYGDGNEDEKHFEEGSFTTPHTYTQAGSFLVKIRATAEDGSENTLKKRVYISGGDSPLAIIMAKVDGQEITLPDPTPEHPNPALEVMRNQLIAFDGTKSLNSEGRADALRYSWNFGDSKNSTDDMPGKSYTDSSPADSWYTVTLRISEISDPNKTAEASFRVKVLSKKPEVATLALEKKTPGSTAPMDVQVAAEGANDPDGRITNYQFWYYDPLDKEKKLAVTDTSQNSAVLTVETKGVEGEEHEYVFCVSATDNENQVSECDELFAENERPRIRVKNGPNQAPVAEFTVSRTNIKVGENLAFTSSSRDPDGQMKEYVWDFEGDGFQNDNPTQETLVTHRYEKKSPESGYRVKLKVIDDKGAAGYSREIPIYVASKSAPPIAGFSYQVLDTPPHRVKFFDESRPDSRSGNVLSKWTWDFDTSAELGCDREPKPDSCNGDETDDEDSTDQNPVFDFPASGTYQVKLTVEDSDSHASLPIAVRVNVTTGFSGGTGTSTGPNDDILRPVLKAKLQNGASQRSEEIQGCTPRTSPECQKKVLTIPATSCGEDVTLFYGDSRGNIGSYHVDKNIYFDSDGNGQRQDDDDFEFVPDPANPSAGTCIDVSTGAPSNSCWTTNFQRFYRTAHPEGDQRFRSRLLVIDRADATKNAVDTIDVVFDNPANPTQALTPAQCRQESLLGGSLFTRLGTRNTILAGIVSGVLITLMGFSIFSFFRGGKERMDAPPWRGSD